MPTVTYITPSNHEIVVKSDAPNLMQAAVANSVDGILGDCGGVAACATCHVVVDEAWTEKVGPATEIEQGMLEFEEKACKNSRLGCQVKLTPELDGLIVRVVG
jgi:ferredoxin, 2Fe-2S